MIDKILTGIFITCGVLAATILGALLVEIGTDLIQFIAN